MTKGQITNSAVIGFGFDKPRQDLYKLPGQKFASDISHSSLQVILNQLFSIIIFYITSTYFAKNIFGEINWCLAVLMLIFSILGSGIDQIAIQKIASGNDATGFQKAYLFHVLLTGISFLTLLLVAGFYIRNISERFNLLLLLSISQLFTFIASPFKQIANGREKFRSLLMMSTSANLIKASILSAMAIMKSLSIYQFALIYIISSLVELMVCFHISRTIFPSKIEIGCSRKEYDELIKESAPQLGVIIFNAAIARLDWILLGILSSSVVLADYSFAYKAFELSAFPLLIIAPVLLPKISRWYGNAGSEKWSEKLKSLFLLARLEIILACYLSLILNIVWAPVIDGITGNKYGTVNSYTILLLSCSVPFLYANNILWSVNFAQKRLKLILTVFTLTFAVVCIGDAMLIPFFRGEGAATAYLTAIITQTFLFVKRTAIHCTSLIWRSLLYCIISAFASGMLARYLTPIIWLQLILASGFYVALVFLLKPIKVSEFKIVKITGAP